MTNKHPQRNKKPIIEDSVLHYLKTGKTEEDNYEIFLLSGHDEELKNIWESQRKKALLEFIKQFPCRRPWAWWKFDAPKEPVFGWDDEQFNSAQRLRLGGIGTPMHKVTCSWGGFDFGIPVSWICEDLKKVGFDGTAINPEDPPRFESEAGYLARLGLLNLDEQKFLAKNPTLLEPEILEVSL